MSDQLYESFVGSSGQGVPILILEQMTNKSLIFNYCLRTPCAMSVPSLGQGSECGFVVPVLPAGCPAAARTQPGLACLPACLPACL